MRRPFGLHFALACAAVAVVSVAAAPVARAFPQLALRPGGTPFEGPTDPEVTALWWNPAALGQLRGLHLFADGQLVLQNGSVSRDAICSSTGLPGACADTKFGNATLNNVGWGGFAGVSWDFRQDNLAIGFGVYMPWETHRSFDGANTAAAGSGQLATAYQLRAEDFRSIYFDISLAVKLSQKLSLGASVSVVDSWASLSFDRDVALDGTSAQAAARGGYERPANAQKINVSGDGGKFWDFVPSPAGFGISLGAMFQPVGWLYLGASWSHVFPLYGTTGRYTSGRDVGSSVTPAASQGDPCGGPCQGGASIVYDIPDVWNVGARMLLPHHIELSAWTRVVVYGSYSNSGSPSDQALVVQLSGTAVDQGLVPGRILLARGLQPTVAGELGVRWRPLPPLRLGFSLIAESSSVPAQYTSAEALDGPKLDGMVAAELRLRWFRLMLGYELTGYIFASPNPGAYDPAAATSCADASYKLSACTAALNGQALPSNAGSYSLVVQRISVAVGVDF